MSKLIDRLPEWAKKAAPKVGDWIVAAIIAWLISQGLMTGAGVVAEAQTEALQEQTKALREQTEATRRLTWEVWVATPNTK